MTLDLNYLAVAGAAVAGFVVSFGWYAVFGDALVAARGSQAAADPAAPPWKIPVEVLRSVIVAAALAALAALIGVTGIGQALLLAAAVWLAFPVVLLLGSVLWEDVPWKLAAIHAGDWLLKLVVLSVIVSLWR